MRASTVVERSKSGLPESPPASPAGMPERSAGRDTVVLETMMPSIPFSSTSAARCAAVLVSGRRWDLHLDNNVTVKLPEKHVREALAQLVALNQSEQLLARDVVVVDLRLPDRVTVRLPEGRSLDDVTSDLADAKNRSRT